MKGGAKIYTYRRASLNQSGVANCSYFSVWTNFPVLIAVASLNQYDQLQAYSPTCILQKGVKYLYLNCHCVPAVLSQLKILMKSGSFLQLRTAMINGETGYLSMDVKVPMDKGVSIFKSVFKNCRLKTMQFGKVNRLIVWNNPKIPKAHQYN